MLKEKTDKNFKLKLILFIATAIILPILFVVDNYICESKIGLIANIVSYILVLTAMLYLLFLKQRRSVQTEKTGSFKWFYIVFWSVVVLAVLVRAILFVNIPEGLNADEASMLYEAYSLSKFGIDRNGTSFPVYLEAWGNGQNALLTYLTIPFVVIFGMNVFSARIVSLIFSIVSLFAFYYLIKKLTNNKTTALVAMIIFMFSPYTIMISRWGLESNLLPHFILYGTCFIVKAYKDNFNYIFLSCIIFGIGLYSYAIAYLFVPLYLLAIYIYFIVKKKITKENVLVFILANANLFLLAVPLILFLLVNNGVLKEIHLGIFTIPKMRGYRGGEISLKNVIYNFAKIPRILFVQNDFLSHNTFYNLGFVYFIILPFIVWGVAATIKNLIKHKCQFGNFLLITWLVCALIVSFLIKNPNANKINVIWFVWLAFAGIGASEFIVQAKVVFYLLLSAFVLMFGCFDYLYFTKYNTIIAPQFNSGLIETINFANSTAEEKPIYFSINLHEPYIYCLIADEKSPQEFIDTVQLENPITVKSYGHYYFKQTINKIEDGEIYVLDLFEFNEKFKDNSNINYKIFNYFVVVY